MNMTTQIQTPSLHLASPEDDIPPMPAGVEPKIKINRKPATRYAVDRGDGLEPMLAADEAEARATIKKQVVSGGIGIVYIYQLIGAEVYEPTSVSLSVDELEARLPNPVGE
jgi:hypothetical protein